MNPAFAGETVTTSNLIARLHRARSRRPRASASAHRRGDPLRDARRRRGHHRQRPPLRDARRRSHPHAADVLARPHQRKRPAHRLVRRRQHAAHPRARREFLRAGRPGSNAFWQVDEGDERLWSRARACRRRPAARGSPFAEIPLSGRGDAPAAVGAARRPRRRAHDPLHQSADRRRGDADARLLCDAARPQDAATRAARDHIQCDLPGGVRRGPLDRRRADASSGRSTTCSPSRTGPGRATRRSAATPISSSSPTSRCSSGSTCCARNCNRRRGQGERRHRRAGPPRRGCALPARPRALSSPTSTFPASCIARSCARRTRMRASATIDAARRRPRRASSPSSPAPTWRPTASGRCAPLWAIRSRRRQADGGAAALGARARARAPCRRAGRRSSSRRRCEQALDAAELVEVDYEPLPAVTDARAAQAADAPQLHEAAPGNVCFRWARGDEAAVARGVRSRPRTSSRLDLVNNRLIGARDRAARGASRVAGRRRATSSRSISSTQVPHHIRRLGRRAARHGRERACA